MGFTSSNALILLVRDLLRDFLTRRRETFTADATKGLSNAVALLASILGLGSPQQVRLPSIIRYTPTLTGPSRISRICT